MKPDKKLLIIGGDERQRYMPQFLIEKGFDVSLFGFDSRASEYSFSGSLENAVRGADAVILPLPASRDGANINAPSANHNIAFVELLTFLDASKPVYGGMLPKEWAEKLKSKNIAYSDYFEREELALLNAVPTAEGVVGTIITKLPFTVMDSKTAITGFGRCGAAAARALKALGSEVTIVLRNSVSAAKAQMEGFRTCRLSDFANIAGDFDVIINTVPSLIFDRTLLSKMPPGTPVIEIASAPFGIDFDAAQELKIKVIKEGSIPGRTAPKTAGKIISDTICNMIKEGKEWLK